MKLSRVSKNPDKSWRDLPPNERVFELPPEWKALVRELAESIAGDDDLEVLEIGLPSAEDLEQGPDSTLAKNLQTRAVDAWQAQQTPLILAPSGRIGRRDFALVLLSWMPEPREGNERLIVFVPWGSELSGIESLGAHLVEPADAWVPTHVLQLSGFPSMAPLSTRGLVGIRAGTPQDGNSCVFLQADLASVSVEKISQQVAHLSRRVSGESELGYSWRGALSLHQDLRPEKRTRHALDQQEDLESLGTPNTIRGLFTLKGLRPMANYPEATDTGRFRVLTWRDLGRDGSVLPPEPGVSKYVDEANANELITAPCLLTPGFRHIGEGRGFLVCEAPDQPVVVDRSVFALQPRAHTSAREIRLITQYLRWPGSVDIYRSEVGGHFTMSPSGLLRLPVPVPDDDLWSVIQLVEEAKDDLQHWAHDCDHAIDGLFTENTSLREARARLLNESRLIRWRREEAARLDDPDYLIRARYPTPLAYRWREATSAAGENMYGAVLETAENTAAFLAAICLSIGHDVGKPPSRTLCAALGGTGTTFGTWTTLLQEAAGRSFRAASSSHAMAPLLQEIANATNGLQAFQDRRNEDAHLAVTSGEKSALAESLMNELRSVLHTVSSLSEHSLRVVEHVSWNRHSQTYRVRFQEFVGDHPNGVVREEGSLHLLEPLETGSLYLVDPLGSWLNLNPFLVRTQCSKCQRSSTFVPDRAPNQKGHDRATVRSLEHNHRDSFGVNVDAWKEVGLWQ